MVTEPTSSTTTPRRKRRWGDAATVEEGVNVIAIPTATSTAAAAGAIVNAVEDVDENGNGNALPPRSATANNNITVVSATNPPPPPATTTAGGDAMARAAALQASIRERLAALKARTAGTSTAATATTVAAAAGGGTITIPAPLPSSIAPTLSSKATMTTTTTTNASTTNNNNDDNNETYQHKSKKAKIFELDMSTTAPTRLLERKQRREERLLRATAEDDNNNNNQPTEKINPYLAHIVPSAALSNEGGKKMMKKKDAHTKMKKSLQQPQNLQQQRTEEEELLLLDTRLSAPQKSRPKSRPIHFVEPGTYVALGEKKRSIAMKAEESGYISGRKVGNVVKSVGMGGVAVAVVGGGGSDEAAEEEGGATTNYYGSSESGKIGIIEQRLPPRPDAPEIELEDYTTKKRILTSVSDVNVEQNEDAILAAIHDAILSGMPHAVEWWDAELLPSKLRKELAEEEGKSIVSRARKQQQVVKTDATTTSTTTTTTTPVGDAMVDDDANTSAAVAQFHSQTQRQDELIAKCYKYASISHSKTHTLIQHPVPILTPAQLAAKEAMKNKPPTLHLTKAERKRHRKLRRAERLREQQDLQAAGLIPPPEPRLTLSNYMKVLGDQAVIDPSKMEAVVMNQIQGRKLKHDQMNAERKLSKEQKAAKHAKKLQEDTTQSVHVALFYVKDMSHPYHRTKVDLNAQQNSITGGVLECASIGYGGGDSGNDGSHSMALVVAEGGEKAVKRYVRLMTMRMRWKGEDFYEDDDDDDNDKDHEELMVGDDDNEDGGDGVEGGANTEKKEQRRKKFNPNNECELIWSGLVMKRAFHTFMFQSAESAIVARKILEAKGVAHYWDLAMGHVEGKTS